MKLGVSSYSYSRLLGDGFTLLDAIEHASRTGYDCMDFTSLEKEGRDTAEYAQRIKEACGRVQMEICSYTVGADFIFGSGGDPAQEARRLMGCVDIAQTLSAGVMRHDCAWKTKDRRTSYMDAVDEIAPYIREVSLYAAQKNIPTMCENHGYFIQDSCRMEYLVRAVNCENFGLLVDIGNFLCADEDPVAAVGRLLPYIRHVHAKDFLRKDGPSPGDGWFISRGGANLRGTVVGHGVVPVDQCIGMIKRSGYDGAVTLEFEGLEEPLAAIEAGYRYLRRLLD